MYVIDVIPFSRTAPAGTLSYRSREPLAEGSVIEVSLRRRIVQGLVVSCVSVAEAKAMLKSVSFMLTKISPTTAGTLPPTLLEAAERIAHWHAASLGSTLASLFGEHIRSDLSLAEIKQLHSGTNFEIKQIEDSVATRAVEYRAIINTQVAAGKAALFVVPTIAETEFWKKELQDFNPLMLSGILTGKKREAALARAVTTPGLLIVTPSFAWTPIQALGAIIIERAGAGTYRAQKRPYLDFRIALTELARSRKLQLVYGDYPLPLEYRAATQASLHAQPAEISVLDLRREKPEEQPTQDEEPWAAVPRVMREQLAATLTEGGRAFVLAVRKGYAPSVVCRDCGTARTDEFGNVLTFTKEGPHGRVFRTVDGRIVESANVVCANCGSWNLLPLGVGVERVEEELREAFPDAHLIRFDGDLVRTPAMARKALEHAGQPNTIVIGTEGALPWILALGMHRFDLACIASADSLLALPFWRARERFVRLGLLLSQLASRTLLGTRLPKDSAVDAVVYPDDTPFFEEESTLRKALGYPPFGTLIAVQAEATHTQLDSLDVSIRTAIGTHAFIVLPDRALTRTLFRRSYVIKLGVGVWPNEELSARLRTLPPSVRILIDPETF